MRSGRAVLSTAFLAVSLACGGERPAPRPAASVPSVDPTTAGSVRAVVRFEGEVTAPAMMRLDGDPKCVTESGSAQRADESIVVGPERGLQNAFVYVKDGLTAYGFPIPTEPVVLDQDKCRYTPRVIGVRVGQPLEIRNSDPLLHNVRSNSVINQPFNKSTPIAGVSFTQTFATTEVMVPMKCDVHAWMSAYIGVLDHPYFATTGADGQVTLPNLPPGTYTIEAWHETLGTRTAQVTIGPKDTKDVALTFAR